MGKLVECIGSIESLHFKQAVDIFKISTNDMSSIGQRCQKSGLQGHINYDKSFDKPLIVAKDLLQIFAHYTGGSLRLKHSYYRICVPATVCCDVLLVQDSNVSVIMTRS